MALKLTNSVMFQLSDGRRLRGDRDSRIVSEDVRVVAEGVLGQQEVSRRNILRHSGCNRSQN